MLLRSKHSGWTFEGKRTPYFSGGGGPSQTTSYQTNLPEYAQPYVESMLNATQKQLFNTHQDADGNTVIDSFKEYQPYSSNVQDYFAPMSQGQNQAYAEALGMRTPSQFGQATSLAGAAGMGGLDTVGRALGYGQQGFESGRLGQGLGIEGGQYYGGMGAGFGQQAADIGQMGLRAERTGQQIGRKAQDYARQAAMAGQNFAQQATNPAATQAYMSPYMQNVVDTQKAAAIRDYQMAMPQLTAQAAKAGAFGGSRDAITRSEAARNLTSQLQNIQAQGQQQAFQNAQAQQQFGANLGLQGLAGAQQGLGTALQGGQLGLSGIGTALQGMQTGIQGAGMGLQGVDRQLAGTAQGMQGAGMGLQGVQGAQAGYSLANQAASNLSNIGTAQQQADVSRINLANTLGQQQQAYQQQLYNQAIQDYATQQQYPLMQLGFMSNMLRGLPMQATTTQSYMPTANPLSQMIGTLGAGANIYNAFKAEGGQVKSYAKGGIASYDIGGGVKSDLYRMGIDELEEIAKNTTSNTIREDAKRIAKMKELGLAKANGGIIAFSTGKTVSGRTAEDYELKDSEELKARREADIAAALALQADRKAADTNTASSVMFDQMKGQAPTSSYKGIVLQRPEDFKAQVIPDAEPPRKVQKGYQALLGIDPNAAPSRSIIASGGPKDVDAEIAAEDSRGILQAKKDEVKQKVADAANTELVKNEVKKDTPAPVAAPVAKKQDTGIKAVTPTATTTGSKIPGLSPTMQALYDASKDKEQSIDEIMAERAKMKEKYVGPNTAAAAERQRLMDERVSLKDEAARQKSLRMAAFFANWGSTPGPTLVAGMSAFQKAVPGLIDDEKEARKAQNEVNKIIRELDKAAYLEKEGDFETAYKIKTDQAKAAKDLNKTMMGYVGQKEAAQVRATGTDKIQQEKLLISAQKELRNARTALTNLSSQNKDLYKAANAPVLENEPKAYTDKRNKAKEEIARKEAPHLAQIEEAQATLKSLRKHGDIAVPSEKEVESAALGTAANPIKIK